MTFDLTLPHGFDHEKIAVEMDSTYPKEKLHTIPYLVTQNFYFQDCIQRPSLISSITHFPEVV